MESHSHYEELCALAVAGQLSPDDWPKLSEHLKTCEQCRDAAVDFEQIAQLLTDAGARQSPLPASDEMAERLSRFTVRARSEGIPLTDPGPEPEALRPENWARSRTSVVWVTVVVVVSFLSYLLGMRSTRSTDLTAQQSLRNIQKSPVRESPTANDVSQLSAANLTLKEALRTAQEQEKALTAQLKDQRQILQSAQLEKADLTARVTNLESENSELRNQEPQRSAEIASLKRELEKLRSEETADRAASLAAEAELRNVRERMAKLASQLDEQRLLTATLEDARRIIVSRNVHVIDIGDVNARGKKERPFGRIFYAEGQKLVFYAYDLSEPGKLDARNSFYVWGFKEGASAAVRRLGRLQSDDKKDDRWVLRLSDPDLLSQIDAVFVTIEPDGRIVDQPRGRSIMTTSLVLKPNHP